MSGFSNEEAQLAINMNAVVNNLLNIKELTLVDVETLKGWVAEAEADGNTRTRVYTFMDLQDDENDNSANFKKKLALVLEMGRVLLTVGAKKLAQKKTSSAKGK